MMPVRVFPILPMAAVFAAAIACGCGGNPDAVVAVSGTATAGGKPLPDLFLHFVPEKGLPSVGVTDETGHFQLNQMGGRSGAALGTHRVWVSLRPTNSKDDPAMHERMVKYSQEPLIQEILRKYGSADTSTLTVEIRKSETNLSVAFE